MSHLNASLRNSTVLRQELVARDGVLLLPTRLAPDDLARLPKVLTGRKVAWLHEPADTLDPAIRAALQQVDGEKWDRDSAGRAATVTAVTQGTIVIYVQAAVTAMRGTVCRIPRPQLEELLSWNLPVQPLAVEHPRECALAVEPESQLQDAVYCFSRALSPERATLAALVEAMHEVQGAAFSIRPAFEGHLGRYLVAGLKAHSSEKIIDGLDGKVTSYAKVFAAAAALAGHIRAETKASRVGIVLPPGTAGLVANLAVVFAGKVPVNLNFTAGKDSVESAIRQAEIDRFITADTFVRKQQTFPWPPNRNLIFIERVLPSLKGSIIRWLLLQKILPASLLSKFLGIPEKGGDEEATLLFTSGSSGEPKGVVLSHRNLIANVMQFGARLDLPPGKKILGCLPLFHSFGCTVTLWYPCIEGAGLVTYPSPLDPPKLAELIHQHEVDVLLATPTFLRGYLRRVKVEQLASLSLVVTGAEKLPMNLEEEFRRKFGKPVMEGYGLTETSPVTNVNLPEPKTTGNEPLIPSRRLGSTGQLMPGVAVRITDSSTGEPLPVDQSGMIWLRGPNIFKGYLKQPRKTEEVIQDGWFRTGDIGRMDGDGFLYIEGRLSRFSKIGGEMVPHETVEAHINRALGLDGDAERRIAVVGVPDPDKGEALVLLSTVASEAVKQELIQLRYTLLEHGVSSLWIPKKLVRIEQIPVLASGKLDIKGCERIAARAE